VTVFWRKAAQRDIVRIVRHIAEENPIAAKHLARELLLAGDSLAMFPRRGRQGRVRGTRELVAYAPYILVYRISDTGEVIIVRVWHGARNRPG
jgi:plasmid stabilization system protein ParE